MTTLTITLQGACAAGGHLDIGVSVNAGPIRHLAMTVADVQNALDDDGKDHLVAAILKVYSVGKTRAEMRAGLLAGLVVTI